MNQQSKAPHSATIWDETETWWRAHIESFQLDALRRQLARVQQTSAHYQRVFLDAGFEPGDLKSLTDLRKLPFTRKSDYVAGLQLAPPFGSLAAVAPGEAVRVHFSSGTTALPAPVLWTQADIERWADLYARYLRRACVVAISFSACSTTRGLSAAWVPRWRRSTWARW
jgi:phenylacetate-CoA ligase